MADIYVYGDLGAQMRWRASSLLAGYRYESTNDSVPDIDKLFKEGKVKSVLLTIPENPIRISFGLSNVSFKKQITPNSSMTTGALSRMCRSFMVSAKAKYNQLYQKYRSDNKMPSGQRVNGVEDNKLKRQALKETAQSLGFKK